MLPEDDQPAARSEQQVLKAAATHPDDHGEAGNSSRFSRRRGTGDRWDEVHGGDVDAAPDSGSDDMDHDDPHDKPVSSDFEDDRPRVPDDHIPGFDSDENSESDGGLHDDEDGSKSWQVTKAMRAHLDRSLRAIRERTATDFIFPLISCRGFAANIRRCGGMCVFILLWCVVFAGRGYPTMIHDTN